MLDYLGMLLIQGYFIVSAIFFTSFILAAIHKRSFLATNFFDFIWLYVCGPLMWPAFVYVATSTQDEGE